MILHLNELPAENELERAVLRHAIVRLSVMAEPVGEVAITDHTSIDIQLSFNGIEVDFAAFILKYWEYIDRHIEQRAVELVKDKLNDTRAKLDAFERAFEAYTQELFGG
jgi:hypothetical protein